MATKGTLWIWLTLLAVRGVVVFCFYIYYQRNDRKQQPEEVYSAEAPVINPLPRHYRINKVHTGGINFFMLG